MTNPANASGPKRPTDPAHADRREEDTPGGRADELMEQAAETGATTDPEATDIGEQQRDRH
ncbi:MAG: hypothetical protein AB7W59_31045 [Acidimicrobiia bacterium]